MTHQEFMDMLAPYVQKYAKQYGYSVVSPILAQASCESWTGNSISKLASKYNNFFGMKCGTGWTGKSVNMKTGEEYTKGTITTISANFRAYSTVEEGVEGYFKFIAYKRYANLKTATTPLQYLTYIKQDGYATSSTYVNTCMSRISKYNLTKYDSATTYVENPSNDISSYPTLRKGSKGTYVNVLQQSLNYWGYAVAVDSIFGAKTESAVKKYQIANGLTVDGIVGQKTWAKIFEGVI